MIGRGVDSIRNAALPYEIKGIKKYRSPEKV